MSDEKQQLKEKIERIKNQFDPLASESSADKRNPSIANHGQIKEIVLPSGWVEGAPYNFRGGIGTRSFKEVHPIEAPQAMLSFFYRGLPVKEENARVFHALLEKKPHTLTEKEVQSLGEVLRDKLKPEDFSVFYAQTEDWNGKRVLCIEGRYKAVQEDAFEIFVDASGDGSAIQEIFFQAPKDSFLKYAKAAKESMRSITWK